MADLMMALVSSGAIACLVLVVYGLDRRSAR